MQQLGGTGVAGTWERGSSLTTPDISSSDWSSQEPTHWIIHGERVINDTRRLRLSIARVELPDGAHLEHYVLRTPGTAITVLLDDAEERCG